MTLRSEQPDCGHPVWPWRKTCVKWTPCWHLCGVVVVSTAEAAVRSVGLRRCHYGSIFGNVCCSKGQIKKHRNPHTAGGGGEGGHPQTLTSILNTAVLPERRERGNRAREGNSEPQSLFLNNF